MCHLDTNNMCYSRESQVVETDLVLLSFKLETSSERRCFPQPKRAQGNNQSLRERTELLTALLCLRVLYSQRAQKHLAKNWMKENTRVWWSILSFGSSFGNRFKIGVGDSTWFFCKVSVQKKKEKSFLQALRRACNDVLWQITEKVYFVVQHLWEQSYRKFSQGKSQGEYEQIIEHKKFHSLRIVFEHHDKWHSWVVKSLIV